MSEPYQEGEVVFLDRTTAMILNELVKDLAAEPPAPDHDVHSSHELEEVALIHYTWERKVRAWRLLAGIRLTEAAIDQTRRPA